MPNRNDYTHMVDICKQPLRISWHLDKDRRQKSLGWSGTCIVAFFDKPPRQSVTVNTRNRQSNQLLTAQKILLD